MTATYGFQLGGTLTATPCRIMLFVLPQDGVLRPKLCAIGCMMRNFTPDVHGEVHLCKLNTIQRGTDGPNDMLNGPLGIGITLSSPMSVAYAFDQTIVGFVFGDNLVRLNVFETVSSDCSKVAVPYVLGWHYVGPTYATGGHGMRRNSCMVHE